MRETDITPALADVAAPVLIVTGANDWSRMAEMQVD